MGIRAILLVAVGTVVGVQPAQVFADEPSAIFVMKVDGGGVRRVAEVEGYRDHAAPRWAHDGTRLVFDADPASGAHRRRFLVDAEGGGLVAMGLGAGADWSPDDKQLVFAVGDNAPFKHGIWVQNADGRGRQWLAEGFGPRWSPDGSAIAVIDGKALNILDLVEGKPRKLVEIPAGIAGGFDWSPDGKQLAFVTADDGQKELWIVDASDAETKKKILAGKLGGHVTWSPDGKRLAIALDGQIQLLAADGSGAPAPIPGQEGNNRMPAWSADGRIAFVSDRQTPALVPVARKERSLRVEEVKRYTPRHIVYGLTASPDGRKAFVGGRHGLKIWDTVADEEASLDFFQGQVVALSSDGRTLAACGAMVKVQLGDVVAGKWLRDLSCGGMCTSVDFSPDGRLLVASLQNRRAIVWDVARGKQLCVFKEHTRPVTRVVFLASGEEVASNGQDKTLRVWNARTGKERLAIAHPDAVWGLAVSPDGRLIATGTGGATVGNPISQRLAVGNDNILRLWDAASGELVREMKGHTGAVFHVDFSPDGRTLASGGWDATVRLWDVESGRQLASVKRQGSAFIVAFTPDGRGLFVAGGESRSAGLPVVRFRDEEVMLYRVVEAGAAAIP